MMTDTRKNRWIALLLTTVLLSGLLAGCGKQPAGTDGITATVTPVPTMGTQASGAAGTPAVTGTTGIEPLVDTSGGIIFTKGSYTADYTAGNLPAGMSGAGITADDPAQNKTVKTGSSFLLTTTAKVTEQEVRECLRFTAGAQKTEIAYELETLSETTYRITPQNTLQGNSLYRFVLGDINNPYGSFAFQTDTEALVSGLYPADLSTGVPVNTGIEMTFSEVIATDCVIADFFTVSPSVEGTYRLYPDGKTVVFIPSVYLSENTVYSIEIKKGLPGISGKTLQTAVTAQFRTANDTSYNDKNINIYLYTRELTITDGSAPTIDYACWYNDEYSTEFNDIQVEIWQYSGAAECIEAMKDYQQVKADYLYGGEEYLYSTTGLSKLMDYTAEMSIKTAWYYRTNELVLPALPDGNYLLNVRFSGSLGEEPFEYTTQVLLQITDLVVYTESADGSLLLWINDAETGTVKGASLTADCFTYRYGWNVEVSDTTYTTVNKKTDEDGLAVVELGSNHNAFVLVESGEKTAYACVTGESEDRDTVYHSYLYTDREIYFAEDTVNFFGVVLPGNDSTVFPKTLCLQLYGSVNGIPVTVEEDGSFRGSFTIDNEITSWLNLTLTDSDGNYVTGKYIEITQEEKPLYTANISFDKPYYRIGDTVTLTLTAGFYDGTPAPGLTFDLSIWDGNATKNCTAVIGEDGTFTYSYVPDSRKVGKNSTSPVSISASCSLIGEDLTDLYVYESAYYFHSNMIVDVGCVVPKDGSDSYTELQLHYRDFEKLLTKEDLSYSVFPQNSYGAAADGSVSVRLYEYEYVKTPAGTSYDPITKTTRQLYNYSTVQSLVKSYTAKFTGGTLNLLHVTPKDGFSGYYEYEINYIDPDTERVYCFTSYANEGSRWYNPQKAGAGYSIEFTDGPYSIGDLIECRLTYDGEEVNGIPVLYTLYEDGVQRAYLSRDGKYNFTYTAELAPCARFIATLEANGCKQSLLNMGLLYDYENNNMLNLNLTTDKTSYYPGETAQITVKAEGITGTGAFVCLSVVDEACFALGEQTIELSEFFNTGWTSITCDARFSCMGDEDYFGSVDEIMMKADCENEAFMASDSAATGELTSRSGENVTIRETFLDNPLFTLCELSEDGTAVISFTTPDNITEWRLSAVAVNPLKECSGREAMIQTELGTTTTDIICTLPFFLSAEVNETFLEGDDIVASGRVFGTELTAGETVTYQAELYDESGRLLQTLNKEDKAGTAVWFNFGKLGCEDYQVIIKAWSGSSSDGVKLSFTVVESGVMMTIRKDLKVTELSSISPMMYPVILSFYDSAYEPYVQAVNQLLYSYSSRYDSLAAYYIAEEASDRLFGSEGCQSDDLERIKQTLSGTYGLLPVLEYGEGNAAFTAKVCALAPEALTASKKAELLEVFTDILSAEQIADAETLTACLFGLAALGAPVLNDLNYSAACSAEFSLTAKLYLTAAYAYLGDFSSAAEIYDTLAAEYRSTENGEIYFEGVSTEETIRYTAYALMSAALIRKTDAEGMYRYLQNHTSTVELYQLEQAAYVKYFYPLNAKNTSFTWKVGETEEKVELNIGGVYSMTLNRADFEVFAVLNADENVRVRATYLGSADAARSENTESGKLGVTKTVTVYNAEKNLYRVTLEYSITTDRNDSFYSLADYIPSGARYYEAEDNYNSSRNGNWYNGAYIYCLSGQTMKGGIYIFRTNDDQLSGLSKITITGSVSYIIRGAVEGSFVVDSAVVQDRSNGNYAASEKAEITLK